MLQRARELGRGVNSRVAPAAAKLRYTTAKFFTCGPVITGTPKRAGSIGLWPPVATSEPPMKATSASW